MADELRFPQVVFSDQGLCEYHAVIWSVGSSLFRVVPFDVPPINEDETVYRVFQEETTSEFRLEMAPTFEQAYQVAMELLRQTAKRVEAGEIS